MREVEPRWGESLWVWVFRFFPIFKYNNLFSEFKLMSVLNFYLFTIRFVGVEYIRYISYIFIFIFILSVFINIFFSYSKYEIILNNKSVFWAIGTSSKIATLSLKSTFKIYIFMFLLNMRVILNFIIFLSFPILMIWALGIFSSKIWLILAISILSVLFLIFILFLWYLSAVLDIFKSSIWYFAYKHWRQLLDEQEKKKSDI